MKKLLIFVLAAITLAACTQSTVEEVASGCRLITETLNATFESSQSDTRIQLNDEQQTVWTHGDNVSVFYYSDRNLRWVYQGKTGERTAKLKHAEGERGEQTTEDIVVIYPYRWDNELYVDDHYIRASLESSQSFMEGSYGLDGNLMVARTESRDFELRSLCGWVKVQLKGENRSVVRMMLKGNNEEQVAGSCHIDLKDLTATPASKSEHSNWGDQIYNEIIIESWDPVELNNEEPTAFYFGLFPQMFSKGITVEITYSDGTTQSLVREEPLKVQRNHIVPMETVTVDNGMEDTEVANNEIVMVINSDKDINEIIADINIEAFDVELDAISYTLNTLHFEFSGDITHIGDFAFRGCDWIEEVHLPNSLETMGVGVFAECPNLNAIYSKYSTRDNRVVVIDDTLVAVAPHDVVSVSIDFAKYVGDYTFYGCEQLENVSFLDGVEIIGAWSFCNCVNLLTAFFGDDVETIKEGAFYNCPLVTFTGKFSNSDSGSSGNIQDGDGNFAGVTTPPADGKVDLGDSTGVTQGAMQNNTAVTKLTIPEGVTNIAAWAFDGCIHLKTVICMPIVPPTALYSETGVWAAFDNNAEDRKFYVPGESLEAYKSAEGWRDYAEWIFPLSSAPEDDDEEEVEVVSEILYTNGSTTVPTELYNESGFDATIVSHKYDETRGYWVIGFDKELTVVGEMAFNFVEGVTRVIIPEGVKRIEHAAFYNCKNLESITLPESLEEVGESVFAYCNMLEKFEGECRAIVADGRCVIIDNTFRGFAFACGVTEYTIPSGVIRIGDGAFRGCNTLTRIVVPEGVEVIEDSAFSICNCMEYQLPESLKTIAEYAFGANSKLRSITIPQNVNYIGEYAFDGCINLETFYCNATEVPTLGKDVFKVYIDSGRDYIGCEIRVPAESVEAYKTAAGWSEYADYIVAM